MPSNARALFDEILGQVDRYAFLESLVTDPPSYFETEWLDFKGRCQPNDILKTWSEAVSGFANTEGGVLIWGIDCRKVDGVDAANQSLPIVNPLALKSQLHTNINQTTDPPVQGIEIEVVERDGKGFVVCYIPESENKPHRAEQAKNKPYMIRCGDSFVIANPSLLRSMFYPRSKPRLIIEVQAIKADKWPLPWDRIATRPYAAFIVMITNKGTASAENIFVLCASDGRQGDWHAIEKEWTARRITDAFGFTTTLTLHPGMPSQVAVFDPGEKDFTSDGQRRVTLTKFKFSFLVFARDIEPQRFNVEFVRPEIEDRITKSAVFVESKV